MPLYTRDKDGSVKAAADQIVWAGDTNLYRSAADTLRTDDSLIVGAVLTVLGAAAFTGAVTGVSKMTVGLPNVDNTADAAKPVSTAAQTALDLKAPLASPTFTGTVAGVSKAAVGLPNVDNTSDAAKPVSTAQATANALRVLKAGDTMTGLLALAAGAAGVGGLTIGGDVNLYRPSADVLRTDDRLAVQPNVGFSAIYVANLNASGSGIQVTMFDWARNSYESWVTAETYARFIIRTDGAQYWGPGNTAQDTNLYRGAAGQLSTDHTVKAVIGFQNNNYAIERAFLASFGTAANEKVDLYVPGAFTGAIEVSISGQSGGADAIGTITAVYAFSGSAAGVTYGNTMQVQTAIGPIVNQFALMPIVWDATNTRWKIPIGHRTTATNQLGVRVRFLSVNAADVNTVRTGMNVSAVYTTDATVPVANVVEVVGVFKPGRFTTALRPTAAAAGVGGNIFDSTLNRPIWSTGSAWVDAAGVAV